jgi:hypothetical protein
MNRDDILEAAAQCVSVDRAATYGDAAANFQVIADLWSAYLKTTVNPVDVGAMLALFKIARAKANPTHTDSWVDGCGYLSLAGEIAERGKS